MVISGRSFSLPSWTFDIMSDLCIFLALRYLKSNLIYVMAPHINLPAQPQYLSNILSHEKSRSFSSLRIKITSRSKIITQIRSRRQSLSWDVYEVIDESYFKRVMCSELFIYSILYKWMGDEKIGRWDLLKLIKELVFS